MVNMVYETSSNMASNIATEARFTRKTAFSSSQRWDYTVPPIYLMGLPQSFRVLQWFYPKDGSPRTGVFEFLEDPYELLCQRVFVWQQGSSTMTSVPRPPCLPVPPPTAHERVRKEKVGASQESLDSGYTSSITINPVGQNLRNSNTSSHTGSRLSHLFANVDIQQTPSHVIMTYSYTRELKPIILPIKASLEQSNTSPMRNLEKISVELNTEQSDTGSDHCNIHHRSDTFTRTVSASGSTVRCSAQSPETGLPDEVPEIDEEYLYQDPDHLGIVAKGSYGCVWRAVYETSYLTKSVAVKSFYKGRTNPEKVLLEARILELLNSTGSIPVFYGITPTPEPPNLALVQEYFGDGTTLLTVLDNPEGISIDTWLSISVQLAMGLREIHQKGVLINDIKDDNVLVDSCFMVKYIDFGFATYNDGCQVDIPEEDFDRYPHLAPESRLGQLTTRASDIYSLGVVLESIMAEGLIQEMFEVVSSCMHEDPTRRPEAGYLVSELGYIRDNIDDDDDDDGDDDSDM